MMTEPWIRRQTRGVDVDRVKVRDEMRVELAPGGDAVHSHRWDLDERRGCWRASDDARREPGGRRRSRGAAPAAAPATVSVATADAGATATAPRRVDARRGDRDGGHPRAGTAARVRPPRFGLAPAPAPADARAARGVQGAQDETDAFEKGAKEYRDTVTKIILLHYEAKKKEILSGLDNAIARGASGGERRRATRDRCARRIRSHLRGVPRARPPRPRTRCTAWHRSTATRRARRTRR